MTRRAAVHGARCAISQARIGNAWALDSDAIATRSSGATSVSTNRETGPSGSARSDGSEPNVGIGCVASSSRCNHWLAAI